MNLLCKRASLPLSHLLGMAAVEMLLQDLVYGHLSSEIHIAPMMRLLLQALLMLEEAACI